MFFAISNFSCKTEDDPAVVALLDKVISQYEFETQVKLNPLRKEFMKRSNSEKDLLAIVAARDSILRSRAYKPATKWLRHHYGDGEFHFSERISFYDISAPMKKVYERIKHLKQYNE